MKQAIVYLDGQILSGDEAKISIFDLSFLRGFGVFDYMRTYNKIPFHLSDHLKRFKASAEGIGIPFKLDLSEIASIIYNLLEKAPYPEANVKVFLTGGTTHDQFLPEDNPKFIAWVYPLIPVPKTLYQTGVSLLTDIYQRPFPASKSIHYLTAIAGIRHAQKQGAHDILFLDSHGQILETGTANFFAIRDGTIITPKDNILLGITRKVVLDLIEKRNIPVQVRSIAASEIPSFDGAFITGSNKVIVPVAKINQSSFSIHPLTHLLMEDFSLYAHSQTLPCVLK